MPTEPQTALFVFAHQDDEFFCMPAIEAACRRGLTVVCVYLTNGAYGGQSASRRVVESTAVLTDAGVAERDIRFIGIELGIPDGKLHLHVDLAMSGLQAEMEKYRPIEVFVPAWEGGHHDHDVAHAIGVNLAASTAYRMFQFPLYNAHQTRLFRVMSSLPQNGATVSMPVGWRRSIGYLRRGMAYPSQWKTWLGLLPFAAWTLARTRAFVLQPVDPARMCARPHEGTLLYERRGLASYEQVSAAVKRARLLTIKTVTEA